MRRTRVPSGPWLVRRTSSLLISCVCHAWCGLTIPLRAATQAFDLFEKALGLGFEGEDPRDAGEIEAS